MQFDDKVKQLYYQMQVAQKQMKTLQEQHENMCNKEMEISYIKQSLNDLSATEDGKELLVPINNGIFIKTKMSKISEVLVNVGSDIVVDKSIPDTIKMMDVQLEEVKKFKVNIENDINVVGDRLQKLENKFHSIQKEVENV